MRWIALTGVNGFIAHNLALEFLKRRPQTLKLGIDRVLGADLVHSLQRSTHQKTTSFENYDFCLAPELIEKLEHYEKEWKSAPLAVIHNGACSSTTETDPRIFRTLNVESSQELFQYCSQKQIPFLYASSASVYGDGSLGFSDAPELNGEYRPLNLYGQSKHQFDSWVLQQKISPSVTFGLRYFNVFGPHEEHKLGQASLLHWGKRQIETSGVLKLYRSHQAGIKDGEQRRDFVSVFDVVRVTVELLRLSLDAAQVQEQKLFVNVGRGEASSWLEAGRALFTALGKECKIEFVDMPQQLQEHYQNYTKADLSTLHQLGLKQPFLTLEQAFSQSLQEMT